MWPDIRATSLVENGPHQLLSQSYIVIVLEHNVIILFKDGFFSILHEVYFQLLCIYQKLDKKCLNKRPKMKPQSGHSHLEKQLILSIFFNVCPKRLQQKVFSAQRVQYVN